MCLLENGGRDLSIRNNKKCKYSPGTTILEVVMATVILVIAIVPIYRSLTAGAAQEIETTKISMARKILESLRNEMMACPFTEVECFFSANGTDFVEIQGIGVPVTHGKVLDTQKKYKDFSLKTFLKYTDSTKTVIECKGIIEWTNESKKTKTEELVFLLVKP